jgi:membrane protein implicated in regulation of membrane protease activity
MAVGAANGVLDLGIDLDVWPWVWLGVAVVFALVELTFLGGTFVLLPFAVSAFVASILAFYDVPVEAQWAVFVFGGMLAFAVMYRWARSFLDQHELPGGVGAERLVGELGVVTVDIVPHDSDRRGRVTIGAEVWGALGKDDTPVPAGTRVRVAAVVGTRVVVEAVGGAATAVENNREDAT